MKSFKSFKNLIIEIRTKKITERHKTQVIKSKLRKMNLNEEHALDNQIPFLQKLGIKEILPVMVGNINSEEAYAYAKQFENFQGVFVFSTDLSHFNEYYKAISKDKLSISIIENIDIKSADKIDACGIFPLLIFLHLAKLKGWKPKLLEYRNSGDITGDKSSVVGYASFYF